MSAYSISLYPPHTFRRQLFPELAPSRELLTAYHTHQIDEAEYVEWYLMLLRSRRLTPQSVADRLPHGAILCCYEKPSEFCHRHIAAIWLERANDVIVTELPSPSSKRLNPNIDVLAVFE